MKYLFLFLISILIISCNDNGESAGNGIIEGFVFSNEDNTPLENVLIITEPPTQAILSNSEGKFEIRDLTPGDYKIIAEKNGYQNRSITIKVSSNKTTLVNIPMNKSGSGGEPNNSDSLILNLNFNSSLDDSGPRKFISYGNNLTFVPDRHNNPNSAIYFSGQNSYLKILDSRNLNLNGDYTISFWMKYSLNNIGYPIAGEVYMISKYGEGGPNAASFMVGLKDNGSLYTSHYNNGNNLKTMMYPLNEMVWNHICITFSSSNQELIYFVNGNKTDTFFQVRPQNCIYNLYLGGCYFEINNVFNREFIGSLDDIMIFNKILTLSQISTLSQQ